MKGWKNEPIIHSHITDVLPESHSLVYEDVFCNRCKTMLHCGNNECMQTWFETDFGNFCSKCFVIKDVLPTESFSLWLRENYLK